MCEITTTQRTVNFLIKAAARDLTPHEREEVLLNACYLHETENVKPNEAELLLTAIEARNASMNGSAEFERSLDTPVITDAQLSECFDCAPFPGIQGDAEKQRAYLANACLKTSAGYWNGGTVFGIMRHLKLVEDIALPRLTLLGGYFLYQTFYDKTLS